MNVENFTRASTHRYIRLLKATKDDLISKLSYEAPKFICTGNNNNNQKKKTTYNFFFISARIAFVAIYSIYIYVVYSSFDY